MTPIDVTKLEELELLAKAAFHANSLDKVVWDDYYSEFDPEVILSLIAEIRRLRNPHRGSSFDEYQLEANEEIAKQCESLRAENSRLLDATIDSTIKSVEMVGEQEKEIRRLREVLVRICSHAGHPDAAEGCRIILAKAREALKTEGE